MEGESLLLALALQQTQAELPPPEVPRALLSQVFESEGAPVRHRPAPEPREEPARLKVEEQRPGVVGFSGDCHVKLGIHHQEVVSEADGGEVKVGDHLANGGHLPKAAFFVLWCCLGPGEKFSETCHKFIKGTLFIPRGPPCKKSAKCFSIWGWANLSAKSRTIKAQLQSPHLLSLPLSVDVHNGDPK